MSDPRLKKLKIQTGVVKRLAKEKLSYSKEADQIKAKLDKMKAEGKDEYDIKKMNEVLQESLMMVPDCKRRLEKAVDELSSLLAELAHDLPEEDPDMEAAKRTLEDSKGHLDAD